MRANTEVSLALRHVGLKGSQIQTWTGTFAHCIMEFAKYCAKTSIATRFDMCMARSVEEARKGVMLKNKTDFPSEFDLDALTEMMESESAEGAVNDSESMNDIQRAAMFDATHKPNVCPKDGCHRTEPCPAALRFNCQYES